MSRDQANLLDTMRTALARIEDANATQTELLDSFHWDGERRRRLAHRINVAAVAELQLALFDLERLLSAKQGVS